MNFLTTLNLDCGVLLIGSIESSALGSLLQVIDPETGALTSQALSLCLAAMGAIAGLLTGLMIWIWDYRNLDATQCQMLVSMKRLGALEREYRRLRSMVSGELHGGVSYEEPYRDHAGSTVESDGAVAAS